MAESYRTMERYWSQRIAEQIKKQPAGKEFGKPKAGSPEAILGGRKMVDLVPEEQDAVVLAVAQKMFPALVKTREDLAKVREGSKEHERLKAEIRRLEALGAK